MPNAAVKVANVSTTGTIMKRPLPSSSSALGKSGKGAHPLAVFLWGSVISLLVLIAIGSGDRVLVFLNLSDLAWTVGVVFIPLAAMVLIPLTAGMMLPKNAPMLSWRMVIDYPLYAITVALIGAAWVYSVVVTIARPIMFNGWLLGLIISSLKLATATLIAILALIVWTLWLNEHRQKRRPNGALIATMFALLGWIGLCLINGDRFFERRDQQFTS